MSKGKSGKKQWQAPDKNWFGLDPHPTDSMIHWSETSPVSLALVLRSAYDKIDKAGLKGELEMLLDSKYREATNDAVEQSAGASL